MLFQLITNGLAVGSVYALIALSLVLIYKGASLLNLAQGELVTIAAFFSLAILTHIELPYLVTILPAMILAGIFALSVERIVIRPLIGSEEWPILMATWGVSITIRGLAGLIWGHEPRPLPSPFISRHLRWGIYSISAQEIVIIISSLLLLLFFYLFFTRTKAGLAMQAVADNPSGASLSGISVSRTNALTWMISGMVAAVAGITIGPIYFLHVDMGFELLMSSFSAAVLGGFGSIPGAIVGGYLLGIIQTVTGGYMPSAIKSSVPFFILIVVLVLKPTGILGKSVVEKK
ncbi:MAG: livH 17 [Deltaproteobacteria bacterium]|jgi:branched-chain amino acid transport system permease protein|nr:livH 17 [Deltaproteobacteria bacterium]